MTQGPYHGGLRHHLVVSGGGGTDTSLLVSVLPDQYCGALQSAQETRLRRHNYGYGQSGVRIHMIIIIITGSWPSPCWLLTWRCWARTTGCRSGSWAAPGTSWSCPAWSASTLSGGQGTQSCSQVRGIVIIQYITTLVPRAAVVQHAGVLAAEGGQCGRLGPESGVQRDRGGAGNWGAGHLGEAQGGDPGQRGGARGHRERQEHQGRTAAVTSDQGVYQVKSPLKQDRQCCGAGDGGEYQDQTRLGVP